MADGIGGLPGGGGGTGSVNLAADLAAQAVEISDRERAVYRALTAETFLSTSDTFVTWILDQIALRGTPVSVSQLQGFSQFTVQSATTVGTEETTTSTSYTNLATVGPTLTGLSDGFYIVMFGSAAFKNTGGLARMGVMVNATEASDGEGIATNSTAYVPGTYAIAKNLSNGNNTLTARYRVDAGTGSFSGRWLLALRFANP